MKRILAIICLGCLCSCDRQWSSGSGGVSANIDVRSADEASVVRKLEEWLSDRGYERQSRSWSDFTGDGQVKNNKGEVAYPVTYARDFSSGQGHLAWGIASSTDDHRYVTVFHDTEFQADDEDALNEIEREFDRESRAFHEFIDQEFAPSPRDP